MATWIRRQGGEGGAYAKAIVSLPVAQLINDWLVGQLIVQYRTMWSTWYPHDIGFFLFRIISHANGAVINKNMRRWKDNSKESKRIARITTGTVYAPVARLFDCSVVVSYLPPATYYLVGVAYVWEYVGPVWPVCPPNSDEILSNYCSFRLPLVPPDPLMELTIRRKHPSSPPLSPLSLGYCG